MVSKQYVLLLIGIISLIVFSSTQTAEAQNDDYVQKVKFVAAIEETMGHILAAKENIAVGNQELAALHLSHPVNELYVDFHDALKNYPQIDQKIELVLFILKNTNTELTGDDFDKQADEVLSVLNEAKSKLISKELESDPIFKLNVISDLLEMSKMEYAIAMTSNNSLRVIELQDSYAFTIRAENLLDSIDELNVLEKNKLLLQFKEIQFHILNESLLVDVETQIDNTILSIDQITYDNLNSSNSILKTGLEQKSFLDQTSETPFVDDSSIPSWVKLNATWWADGLVPDAEFISGIEYMISKEIIRISEIPSNDDSEINEIPSWIKSRTAWWADGLVPDAEFISGIEYMISKNILQIQ